MRAVASGPIVAARRVRSSFGSNVPSRLLRILYTARQCQFSHGSGLSPRRRYSMGRTVAESMQAFTPAV